jgi:hypothetical protein
MNVSVLNHFQSATQEQLRDCVYLENDLIPRLGLNNEGIGEFPASLHRYAGGLRMWQNPKQLARYWAYLAKLSPIRSYLEVGVRHCGTFIGTLAYLTTINPGCPPLRTLGIDVEAGSGYGQAEMLGWDVRVMNSHTPAFARLVAQGRPWDLALIDGDHSYYSLHQDLLTVLPHAQVIAIHDIVSHQCPDVVRYWHDLRQDCPIGKRMEVIADQYQDHPFSLQGFGLLVPCNYPFSP